ncbi:hypothetical protein N8867_02380 [Flavobacteriaceae bacterium]|jgi:hypothetical protein|nr:hypothetical protein [Flavobacteriaceae bacterium]MBT4298183.1 hypothetical protein [Flavobacteriaceae bacterium]MBT7575391.1 hypothetical protein [Flavobacteriaceae bacterium]MDA7731022.1 hypothetical protein [Flavobacteriaceae bacterium]MDA9617061.1 hypothetical protein [Flavobacteriaceae bacterium]
MSIQIIFFIGVLVFTIFIIGVLLIPRESNINNEEKIETDVMDYDGIGNYGRIPDKDPK